MSRTAACLVLLALAFAPVPAADGPNLVARPDAFPTLVNPNCSHCVDESRRRTADLRPDDPVLCWTRGYSDGGAIPIRFFLNPYRVISDSYGVFVYDPDAGYARGFAPSYTFKFHGWRNGVMVMKDTTDGTLYSCLTGLAFDGPRKGHRLTPVPTLTTTWGPWLDRYPQAVAYHMFDKYKPTELPAESHPDSAKSRGTPDPRLGPDRLVLGVRVGSRTKAYPLDQLALLNVYRDVVGGEPIFILNADAPYRAVAAYRPVARQPRKYRGPRPDKSGVSPPDPGEPLPDGKELPPLKLKGFRMDWNGHVADEDEWNDWDPAGRCVAGRRKGWVLDPVDAVVCKWFAWSAEYPDTELFEVGVEAAPPPRKAADAKAKIKEIAGTAEFLRVLPKPFATLKAIDPKARTVTLLIDGETVAKVWPVEPDAEIKVGGWWGRLEQLKPGDRVWAWLKLDRKRNPTSVAMLADAVTEFDMHGSLRKKLAEKSKVTHEQVEAALGEQKSWLRQRWLDEGLPGTLTFHHVFSGELELMLDHEAIRWGRSLKQGDVVHLTAEPPIRGVVRSVAPWRERTVVRLVVGELESSELRIGQRLGLKMLPPAQEVEASPYPPDLGRSRTKPERVEWFLASIYCTCGVSKDVCTGHFYTLASCNPNGCGMPNATREELIELIDQGKSDREIWDSLLKDRGPLMLKPHLMP
jgi:hypothetical protein